MDNEQDYCKALEDIERACRQALESVQNGKNLLLMECKNFINLSTLNSNSKTAYQTCNTALFQLRKRNISSLCLICASSLSSTCSRRQ